MRGDIHIVNQSKIDQLNAELRDGVRSLLHHSIANTESCDTEDGTIRLIEVMDDVFVKHLVNSESPMVVGLARLKLLELLHQYATECIDSARDDTP